MKRVLIFSALLFLLSGCINQGAKRIEQAAKEKAEKDSIYIIKKPFANDPARIEYEIPVLKGTNLRHGVQKRYYSHGSIYSEIPYIRNERNGIANTYYKSYKGETPKVWKVQPYLNGKLEGICYRYYENGKLQAEYEYKKGLPAVGLKEYTEDGVLMKFPELSVQCHLTDRYYYVTAQLSKSISKLTFYTGDLIEDKFMPENLKKIQDRNGIAELLIPKDGLINKVTVIAVYPTRLDNECILTKTIVLNR